MLIGCDVAKGAAGQENGQLASDSTIPVMNSHLAGTYGTYLVLEKPGDLSESAGIIADLKEKFPDIAPRSFPVPGLNDIEIAERMKVGFPEVEPMKTSDEAEPGKLPGQVIMEFKVPLDKYLDVVRFLKNDSRLKMDMLLQVSAVDWQDYFDVVVHLISTLHGHKVFLRCPVDRDSPVI